MRKIVYCWLVATLAFMAGGCGGIGNDRGVATGGGAPSGSAGASADQEERRRQLTACMDAEGVEVDASAGKPVPRRDVDPEKLNAALEKCRQYLPDGGEAVRLSPEDIEKMRLYAKCIRDHGVPDFPDPDPLTGETPLTAEQGRRLKDNPKMVSATEECRNQLPGGGAREPGVTGGGAG